MPAPVTAERILADLHQFWGTLTGAEPPAAHGVLRASAMTLIVLADEWDDRAAVARILGQVMREHPHRAVVVQVQPGAPLDYTVTAQCWMPFGQQRQVCCEQIEVTGSEEHLTDLAPVLLAIKAPDLPVVIWYRSERLTNSAAARQLFTAAGRVILNSYGFTAPADAMALVKQRLHMADLAWTRITRWREIVAQVFEDPARQHLVRAIDAVRVVYGEDRTPSTAWYLAGWIEAALGRDLAVSFETVTPVLGGIEGVILTGGGHTISLRRAEGSAVLIETDSLKSCTMCPRLSEAELLSNELSISGRDAVFERTLPFALKIAGRS